MPNFLNMLAAHNAEHGIQSTFSELKKTARRLEKAYEERLDQSIDPYAYVLQYADDTGEIACGLKDNPFEHHPNHVNAARRIGAAA